MSGEIQQILGTIDKSLDELIREQECGKDVIWIRANIKRRRESRFKLNYERVFYRQNDVFRSC